MTDIFMAILCYGYNLTLLGGTAYLVQKHDWSPWWFLLTITFVVSFKYKT